MYNLTHINDSTSRTSTHTYVPFMSHHNAMNPNPLIPNKPIHLYTYTPIYLYTYTPIHLYTYTPTHLHTYIPIHVYTYTPIHLYTYTPIHLYTYTPIYLYTYTPIYIKISDLNPGKLFTFSPIFTLSGVSLQILKGVELNTPRVAYPGHISTSVCEYVNM